MRNNRHLTHEERRLWLAITRLDRKLHDDVVEMDEPAILTSEPALLSSALSPMQIKFAPASPRQTQTQPDLAPGYYAGVDGRTAERLRKGKVGIDRVLDLHGHNQATAYSFLQESIRKAYDEQVRVLLVITGKGMRGGGVLKKALPHWLNDPSIRPFILAYDRAIYKNGGDGAYYVLLKRQRNGHAHG